MPEDSTRILFVHAHPDDETLSTGALIVWLTRDGRSCFVLTATRGERGEVMPGPLAALAGTPELAELRARELAAACDTLGVVGHAFLGEAEGLRFTDSGMVWVDAEAHIAGPAPDAPADALTRADPDVIAAAIETYARQIDADIIVSYDAQGGYFHPDHVALHAPSRAAASACGIPFAEIVSDPDGTGTWHSLPDTRHVVAAALKAYASQLTVDGDDVVHVGGQRQPIQTRIGWRRWVTPSDADPEPTAAPRRPPRP